MHPHQLRLTPPPRSGFESVFLGAVRLVRTLAAALEAESRDGGMAGSMTGIGGAIVLVLASSMRVPLADLAISNGLFGLGRGGEDAADEVGPAGIRINGGSGLHDGNARHNRAAAT